MRELLRFVRSVATVLSFLLFVLTSVLWVRSYFAHDSVNLEFGNSRFNGLDSHNGLIWVLIGYDDDVPIPHLFPLLLSVPLLLWWILERTNGRRAVRSSHCAICGYDCRATPDRCPECGAVQQKQIA
jgi:hypothetical protein